MIMGLSWILAGALVAWIVTKKINLRGDDPIVDYGIGVGGAFVGGLVCHFIVGGPMASFSVWCLVAAFVTSVVALAIWHVIRTRGPQKIHTSRANRIR
jgi:uncharacterized membrane protein YeaQ/YmgE (transglycosylase-associated protein family)